MFSCPCFIITLIKSYLKSSSEFSEQSLAMQKHEMVKAGRPVRGLAESRQDVINGSNNGNGKEWAFGDISYKKRKKKVS